MISWQCVEAAGRLCSLEPEWIAELRPLYEKIAASEELVRLTDTFLAESLAEPQGTGPEPDFPFSSGDRRRWYLLITLMSVEPGRTDCINSGNPESAYLDTLADIRVWTAHHVRNFGYAGAVWGRFSWFYLHFHHQLYQMGRLQIQSPQRFAGGVKLWRENGAVVIRKPEESASAGAELLFADGDRMIPLHIPECGPLRPELCRESFRRARDFMAKYHPDCPYKALCCSSWVLDPQLQTIFGPESNVVRFQQLGHLCPVDCNNNREVIWRVFGDRAVAEGLDAVPHTTSMQRKIAAFIRSGGQLRGGRMIVLRDEI